MSRGAASWPPSRKLVLASFAVAAGVGIVLAVSGMVELHFLFQPSAVWLTLARDLSEGIFYRPAFSSDGYGGTRYFPLFFALNAAFARLLPVAADAEWRGLVLAGQLLAVASGALLLFAVARLARRLGGGGEIGLLAASLCLASVGVLVGFVSVRPDLLACALVVLGLGEVAASSDERRRRPELAAGLLFCLAFACKMTALYGAGVAVLALWCDGQRRRAWRLFAATSLGALGLLLLIQLGSEGRAFAAIANSIAESGGFLSPGRLLRNTVHAYSFDPAGLAVQVAGCGLALWAFLRGRVDLPVLFASGAGAVTVAIFLFEGTDFNHLVDLQAASALLVAVRLSGAARPARALRAALALGAAAASVAVLALALPRARSWVEADDLHYLASLSRRLPPPVLAEYPLIPILAQRRPHVLDPFTLRILAQRKSRVRDDFLDKLSARHFSAVILGPIDTRSGDVEDLYTEKWNGDRWYGQVNFPETFLDRLLDGYVLREIRGHFWVLVPRPGNESAVVHDGLDLRRYRRNASAVFDEESAEASRLRRRDG